MNDDIRDHFSKLSDQQKSHHGNVSKELAPLMSNQSVRIYYPDNNQWYIGKILSRERDRSYKVMSSNGAILIRNCIHLRPIVSSDYASQDDTPQYVDQYCNNIMLLYIYLLTKYDEPNLNIKSVH